MNEQLLLSKAFWSEKEYQDAIKTIVAFENKTDDNEYIYKGYDYLSEKDLSLEELKNVLQACIIMIESTPKYVGLFDANRYGQDISYKGYDFENYLGWLYIYAYIAICDGIDNYGRAVTGNQINGFFGYGYGKELFNAYMVKECHRASEASFSWELNLPKRLVFRLTPDDNTLTGDLFLSTLKIENNELLYLPIYDEDGWAVRVSYLAELLENKEDKEDLKETLKECVERESKYNKSAQAIYQLEKEQKELVPEVQGLENKANSLSKTISNIQGRLFFKKKAQVLTSELESLKKIIAEKTERLQILETEISNLEKEKEEAWLGDLSSQSRNVLGKYGELYFCVSRLKGLYKKEWKEVHYCERD